jgi:type VI secretion system protein ImpH
LNQGKFMDRALLEAASPIEPLSVALLEQLDIAPWRYGFFPLMRRLNANPAIDPIGTACLPGAETFRLGQKPSLLFAPREIAQAEVKRGRLHLRLFGLGMLGVNGPLPIHVTEIAREREEQRKDATLCNFLDVFHHRALSLLYRAWASSQSTASLDRPKDDRFSFYAASLSGYPRRRERSWALPEHVRLGAAPHLVRQSRNPDGMRSTLARYFGVPVQIVENELHWIAVGAERQSIMGEESMSLCLGLGATLGERVLDCRHHFRVVIGPLEVETYHRFTPQGPDLLKLIECVRAFVGREYSWELELQIKPRSAPPTVLGREHQLGWSSWLGESPMLAPIVGMRFEPEHYFRRLHQGCGSW